MSISDERLNEMLAGLEGVTPGPWVHEPHRDIHDSPIHQDIPLGSYSDGAPMYYYGPDNGSVVGSSEWIWLSKADGDHIARCDPDTIRALLTELLSLRAAAKVRANSEGDGEDERPFTGSIPKHAKWCQPGDRQDKRMFIVRFDDQDRNDAVFEDEAEARKFYARATVSWNCYLFGALPAHPEPVASIPATGGEKV